MGPLTVQSVLSLVNVFISFSYSVVDFLRNGCFKPVQSLFGVRKLCAIVVTHRVYLSLELLAEHLKVVLKLGAEGLEGVIDTLGLSLSEVAVGLDLALDVLEFGFKLLFGLDALHEHDVVVAVHFDQLVVHCRKRHILVLLPDIACHVLLNEFLLWLWNLGLHDGVASREQGVRSLSHFSTDLDYLIVD